MKKLTLSHYVALASSAVVLSGLIACSGATTSSLESSYPEAPDRNVDAESRYPEMAEYKSRFGSQQIPQTRTDADVVQFALDVLEKNGSPEVPKVKSGNLRVGMLCELASDAEVIGVTSDMVHVAFSDSGFTAFFINVDTSDVIVGEAVSFGPVKVQNTQHYESIAGNRESAFVLDPVSDREWELAMEKAVAVVRAGRVSAMEGALYERDEKLAAMPQREWTDKSGKFSTRAKLVGVENGTCQLEKEDGSMSSVPIDRLSDDDQRYVKDNLRGLTKWKREFERNRLLLDQVE